MIRDVDTTIPLNEEAAAMAMVAIADPVTRNLVKLAVAKARMHFAREADQTNEEWRRCLPDAPFDMHFFVKVLSQAFAQPAVIRSILEGQTIEQATGWDV